MPYESCDVINKAVAQNTNTDFKFFLNAFDPEVTNYPT